jgi:uncharacterized repeat protein (TIGR01451 family)
MEAEALNAQRSAQLCPGGTYRVDWVRYEVDGSTGSVPPELYGFEPLLVHFPSLLASVEERFEVYYELYVKYLTAAAQGLLRWDAEMPPKPWNGGQWSQSEGAIFEGSAFGERVGARWLVEGLALFDWSHARPGQRVTVQNYNFCAHLEGETGFGSLGTVLKELVAFAEVDPACSWAVPPSSWTSTSADGEATQEALAVRDVTYSWDALTGTGATYEGNPVLGDVSADLHQDGAPTAAKSPSGEIIVVWTKDVEAAPAGRLGAEVWLSTYEGIGWSSPITLTTEIDFHDNPAAVFDSSGNLMVIWSQASSAGLEYGVGPPEAVVTAMDESRIAFSRRSGDSWSAPATLADSSGPDLYPVIAAGPSGKLTAAWLNDWEGVRTLYAAFWTGSGWLSPTAVVTGGLISNPVVVYPGPDPVLFWAQDEDQDSLTQGDWRIYSSAWDHFFGRWTEPEPVPVPLPEASVAVSEDLPAHGAGSTTRQPGFSTLVPPPPAECTGDCGGPSGCNPPPDVQDQIDEAGSANVGGIDPNEKTGTLGQGEELYVDAGERLHYTVYFENLETATAPAQELFVTDCLPPELDWTTLSLDEVAFGDLIVANPTEQALFQERVTIPDYRPGEAKTWWVDIAPEFDFATGCLEVVLRTLDPATGELPEDPFAGLLPPEDGSGRGQGHIGFAIAARADLADGTTIDNAASIVFDTNDPIVTNTWTNTIGEPGDCGSGVFNTLTLVGDIYESDVLTACQTIIVGPNTHIMAPADVTLRAGQKVEFRSEVSVATGATLTVEIDPALAPPSSVALVQVHHESAPPVRVVSNRVAEPRLEPASKRAKPAQAGDAKLRIFASLVRGRPQRGIPRSPSHRRAGAAAPQSRA